MRLEELMALVQQSVAEGRSLSELEGPIQALLDTTEDNLQRFLADSQTDAEMPADTRRQLQEAMEDCLDSLEAMQDALLEGEEALERSAGRTLELVERVRELQTEHLASLSEGPTSFAFVNRLLVRADRGDLAQTQQLLEDRFTFLQLLRDELALRTLGPRDSQVLFELQAVLERQVTDLASFAADLLAAAAKLEPLLSRPAEHRVTDFLTVLGVARLATLLKEYQGRGEEGVETALARCRMAVQQSLPPSSPAAALSALSRLLAYMDQIQEDLEEAPEEISAIRSHGEPILALGRELEAARAVPPGAQSFSPVSEGLPLVFRSILEPAYAYLDGRGDSATVFEASQHLQGMLDQMDESQPDPSEDLEEALQVVSEAVEALQAVAGTGNALQVELATELCREAADKLKAAGIRLK